jgi:hypothetical protein
MGQWPSRGASFIPVRSLHCPRTSGVHQRSADNTTSQRKFPLALAAHAALAIAPSCPLTVAPSYPIGFDLGDQLVGASSGISQPQLSPRGRVRAAIRDWPGYVTCGEPKQVLRAFHRQGPDKSRYAVGRSTPTASASGQVLPASVRQRDSRRGTRPRREACLSGCEDAPAMGVCRHWCWVLPHRDKAGDWTRRERPDGPQPQGCGWAMDLGLAAGAGHAKGTTGHGAPKITDFELGHRH